MEREKAANKVAEEIMNQVKESLHESVKDQALT
jgi:ribosome-binding factor A